MANSVGQFDSRKIAVDHDFLNPGTSQAALDGKSPDAQNITGAARHLVYTEPPVLRIMNSSPISGIPNELLNNILAYAVPEVDQFEGYWRERVAIAVNISYTSKLFHQIVQPMLYHTIHLWASPNFDLIPLGQNAKLFFRTMESNPALRSLCKCLRISIRSKKLEGKELSICTSLLLWLTNIITLHVYGGYCTESLLRTALRNMPLLETLRLEKLSLAQVYSYFVLPPLRTMKLHSIVEGTLGGTVGSIIPQVSI